MNPLLPMCADRRYPLLGLEMNCMSLHLTNPEPKRAQGRRLALTTATALAGGMLCIVVSTHSVLAQQVLLAPLGSHRAPSADVPVYAGVAQSGATRSADVGQSDPSPLSIPPELSRPVSLAPDAPTTATAPELPAPIAVSRPPAVFATDTDAAPQPLPSPLAAPRSNPLPSPAQVQPTPRAVAETRRMPTVEPGDAPYFPPVPNTAPAPAQFAQPTQYNRRVHVADNARYPGLGGYLPAGDAGAEPMAAEAVQQDAPLVAPTPQVFAQAATPALSGGSGQPYVPYSRTTGAIVTIPRTRISEDPVTQAIDKSISSLERSLAPSISMEGDYVGHNGQAGLNKMNSYVMPVEAVFSPAGTGQMTLTVTPVSISANRLPNFGANVQSFGTMGFGLTAPYGDTFAPYTYHASVYKGKFPGELSSFGTALDLRYTLGYVSADVGTTPLGFQQQNVVGGLMVSPLLSNSTRVRLILDRRAVEETVISYAGATDPYSGRHWGGVVRTGGRASLESNFGRWSTSVGGAGGVYTGTNVSENASYEMFGRATYPIYSSGRDELRTGVDLHYTSFNKNLEFYTYGQGGYFSPQRSIVLLAPLEYKVQYTSYLSASLDGGIGYQEFNAKKSDVYPTSHALQSALNAITNNPLLTKEYAPFKGSGIMGMISGKIDYVVSPNFSVGAKASFGNAGIYQSYGGGIYGRYVFNDWNAN